MSEGREGTKPAKEFRINPYDALCRYNGEEWINDNQYNIYHKQTAILVAGGPSLNKMDVNALRGPGKVVLGLNNSYPLVKPDMWMGMDAPHCYDRHLLWEAFPKYLRAGYWDRYLQGTMLRDLPGVTWVNVEKPPKEWKEDWNYIFNQTGKNTPTFVWYKNTFAVALNLLLHMGFKDICLAGVDFDNSKADYYNDVKLDQEHRQLNSNLYWHLFKYTRHVAKEAKQKLGVTFRSISPLSKLNEHIPFLTLEELNMEIAMRLPQKGKLYNSTELDTLRKEKRKPRF